MATTENNDGVEVVHAAIENEGVAITFVLGRLRDDFLTELNAVHAFGCALQHLRDNMCDDSTMVLNAVQSNGLAIQFASQGLRSNQEFIRRACISGPDSATYAIQDTSKAQSQ